MSAVFLIYLFDFEYANKTKSRIQSRCSLKAHDQTTTMKNFKPCHAFWMEPFLKETRRLFHKKTPSQRLDKILNMPLRLQKYTLLEKCLYSELFWSIFFRIRTEYSVSLRVQPKCRKIWTRITPNSDTLCGVITLLFLSYVKLNFKKLQQRNLNQGLTSLLV